MARHAWSDRIGTGWILTPALTDEQVKDAQRAVRVAARDENDAATLMDMLGIGSPTTTDAGGGDRPDTTTERQPPS